MIQKIARTKSAVSNFDNFKAVPSTVKCFSIHDFMRISATQLEQFKSKNKHNNRDKNHVLIRKSQSSSSYSKLLKDFFDQSNPLNLSFVEDYYVVGKNNDQKWS